MSAIPAESYRQIALQSQYRCGYCQSQQRLMGVALTIDHIIPQSLGGASDLENLCLACWDCNLAKSDRTVGIDPQTGQNVRLFHPNRQSWSAHFYWNDTGLYIVGKTPVGRATVIALKPQLIEAHRYWVQAGWHPPPAAK